MGTIISYCLYWLLVAACLVYMFYKERKAAISKAERGEFGGEEGDIALENAKQFIGEDGQIIGKDVVDEERIDPEQGEKIRAASIKA